MHARMKQTPQYRRLLLQASMDEDVMQTTLSPDPIFLPINVSSGSTNIRRHYVSPASSLDSSIALTILVILTAIFFMGFFSIYIRRFAQEESAEIRRRNRHLTQPTSSSAAPAGLYGNRKGKGLDPTTVQALPLVSYGEDAKQLITDCTICLTEFEVKEIVKFIPHCKHVFHPHCLDTWLSSHVSCPLCRSTKLFRDPDHDVCLDVKEVGNARNGSRSELQGRSTADRAADRAETWTERTPLGSRRSCSCTNLADHIVLQRSMSF